MPVVLVFAGLSLFFGYHAFRVEMSPDVEGLLPEGDAIGQLMKQYGGGELQGEILVVAARGADLFTLPTLSAYGEALDRIQALPEIDVGITPFNMLALEKAGSQLRVMSLSPGKSAPRTPEDLARFRERIEASPLARNLVISGDHTLLVSIFTCRKTLDYGELMAKVRAVTDDYRDRLDLITSGSVPFLERTGTYLVRDLSTLLGVAALIVLVSYYLGFRTVRGVLFPLTVVGLGTLWCLGFMHLMGYTLTIVTIVIPPLVLILGTSYSIHVLNQYYREAGEAPRDDKMWIADSVQHVNRTILMAAATTIAGLLSPISVSLRQLWVFSIATSFGIVVCTLLSLLLLPAALSLLPHPSVARSRQVRSGLLSRLMGALGPWVMRFRLPIFGLVAVLTAAFVLTANRLEFTTDTISYFPQRDTVVKDMQYLTGKIGGFDEINLTLLAPPGQAAYFLRTEAIDEVRSLERELRTNPDIGYIASFVSYLDYVDTLYGPGAEAAQTRTRTLLLARVFRALSANESIARYLRIMANEDFTRLTLSLRVYNSHTGKFIDEKGLRGVLAAADASAAKRLDPAVRHVAWGTSLRFLAVADAIRKGLVTSLVASVGTVLLIAFLTFRSIRYGLYSLVPLLVGLMLNFVLMVLFSIPLDATTFMVASITIGDGVDNAIHFLLTFRRLRRERDRSLAEVVSEALRITGRPIFLTTATIAFGLTVLLLATFKPIVYFGTLVIIALSATCLATLVVVPAILSVAERRVRPADQTT